MNYKEEIRERIEYIDCLLNKYLPPKIGYQHKVIEAMHYSVLAGGKRIRPMLIKEVYHLFGGIDKDVEPFMAATEMIHTYSLVHDDLPAMDDDDYRRGRKTTHIVYGEAIGILTGDALLNYSFELLSRELLNAKNLVSFAKAMNILASKAGVHGMLGGQVVDVSAMDTQIDCEKLDFIYRLKTSALIEASMMIGAELAGANQSEVRRIESIASKIGMAFQIKDDVLDVTSSTEKLGKPIFSDEKNNKTTYVTLHGVDKANIQVENLSTSALEELSALKIENEFLNKLIINLIYRDK